ncbi:MAG: asparagine synthase-related protein [Bacillota bacterium]
MSPRYLLLVADERAADRALADSLAQSLGLRISLRTDRITALVNHACPCLLVEGGGCIVGTLFHRHGPASPVAAIDPAGAEAIVRSAGDSLLTDFWGGYVAAIPRGTSTRVIRDPSAALPCYGSGAHGVAAFASDAQMLADAGFATGETDWRGLGAHLYAAAVPSAETVLCGIRELLAGFSTDVPGEAGLQRPCWSPWDHARVDPPEPGPAAERLRRIVRHCIASWASAHGRLLLSCSGGLDSSVVAACLAAACADAVCLTMYADDPGGDERRWARALTSHLGLPLVERPYRLDQIDLDEPLGPHLPRPSDRTHALSYEHSHLELAREVGASAFVTGNGGDSVFGHSQSAAAAADRYLAEGLGAGLFATLRDISVQTGCGLMRAGLSAMRIARGPYAYRCRPDRSFLDEGFVSSLPEGLLGHAWLDAPVDALPGKAAHIASVLRIQQCLEPTRGRFLPVINPLMSQPVLEACLAVPSWLWRSGGRDRSLARLAFAQDLPAAVARRRVKGGPDGFAARVLERFRDGIRERLIDGALVEHGIADRSAIEQALRPGRAVGGEERARLLELVAAEAWVRHWRSRQGGGASATRAAARGLTGPGAGPSA